MKIGASLTSAFSLVEITLSLGVMTFCLTTVFGLLPVGLHSNQTAVEQTTAASIATMITADLRAADSQSPNQTPRFAFTIPAAGEQASTKPQTVFVTEDGNATGKVGSAPTADSHYRVSIAFTPPQQSGDKSATNARVLVTWPAKADIQPTEWPRHAAGSFEVLLSLNRD